MCSEVCFHRSKYIYKIIFSSYALATKIINLKMENKQKVSNSSKKDQFTCSQKKFLRERHQMCL